MENQFDLSHVLGHWFSAGAIGVSWGSVFFGIAPAVAALAASSVAFIWYAIQIMESRRMQAWLKRRHAAKVDRVRAKLLKLEANPPHQGP